MRPCAFMVKRSDERAAHLTPCDDGALVPGAWDEFADCVAGEPTLVAYPASVFRARWEQGCAAVALDDGHIVAYTSLMPAFDAALRGRLAAAGYPGAALLPEVDLYEFVSGWTHPGWRRRDVSLALRRELLECFSAPNVLCTSVALGLGASPVLTRLGWAIVPWSQIPFASSLLAVPLAGYEEVLDKAWLMPERQQVYNGPPLVYEPGSTHPWKDFHHFWVARLALALSLEEQLCIAADGDLRGWRDALVRMHIAAPSPCWVFSFYKE